MIHSQLLLDILDLSFEHHPESDILFQQLKFLSIKNQEHTGVGLYTYFFFVSEIPRIKDESNVKFDGIEISNENTGVLAEASVHLENGIVVCVEIWNKIGNYPAEELKTYEVYQKRIDSNKRRIIRG